ncbi:unnamed protein product, partial [Polarella glacialis]
DYIYQTFQHEPISICHRLQDTWVVLREEAGACLHPLHLLPLLSWFPKFLRKSPSQALLRDLLAAVTVAAVTVPQGLAYGLLAKLGFAF